MKFEDQELRVILTEAAEAITLEMTEEEAKTAIDGIYGKYAARFGILTEERLTAIAEHLPDLDGMTFIEGTRLAKTIVDQYT